MPTHVPGARLFVGALAASLVVGASAVTAHAQEVAEAEVQAAQVDGNDVHGYKVALDDGRPILTMLIGLKLDEDRKSVV